MNRFTLSAEDLIIQRIFNNESRNVVNPRELLSALLPEDRKEIVLHHGYKQTRSQHFPAPQDPKRPSTQVNIGPSMKDAYQQPSSKGLVSEQDLNLYPSIDQEDYNNVYGSNIKFEDDLALDSKINHPKKSKLDVEQRRKK